MAKNLQEAAAAGELARVKELLTDRSTKINATVSKAGTSFTALHLAVQKGHLDIVKILLEAGSDVNKSVEKKGKKKTTAVLMAVKKGYIDIVKVLIDAGANLTMVDSKGNTPLDLALVESKPTYLDMATMIIDKIPKDVKADSARYIRKSIYHANLPAFQLLLAKGLKFDGLDSVQLWRLVIKKGHLELLKLLIECGLKIDEKKKRTQTTALHFASKKGTTEIVRYLLESTSLINCINDPTLSRGLTPLHYAAEKGMAEIAELLLERGADVNKVALQNDKATPLHFASEKGYPDVVQILLKHKASVDAVNGKYLTSLHLASKGGYSEIVRLLLDNGADLTLKSGCTAREMAMTDEVVEIIKEYQSRLAETSSEARKDLEISALKDRVFELEEQVIRLNMALANSHK
eukprot:TRINITY_DN230_c0_g2_i1.p1 TRINITY_DN230_c0_g2~~TRINITY_DN230_c0_g2_i1.p1  ORF type:complete len:444 (+),score=111.11 TRINITY_DN230_c0_g2_i1:117-1334(+)